MVSDVYARVAELEIRHWWFLARRQIVSQVLRRQVLRRQVLRRHVERPAGGRVLEAGCGTGGNLSMHGNFGEVAAFEPGAQARALARCKGRESPPRRRLRR